MTNIVTFDFSKNRFRLLFSSNKYVIMSLKEVLQVFLIKHFFSRFTVLSKISTELFWGLFAFFLLTEKCDQKVFVNFVKAFLLFVPFFKERFIIQLNRIKKLSDTILLSNSFDSPKKILRSCSIVFLIWSSPSKTYPLQS